MYTVDVESRSELVAPDSTIIRELLSPQVTDVNVTYSLAHGTIPKGKKTLLHSLRSSSEAYYILVGTARIWVNEDAVEVGPGALVYVPSDAVQYVENTGDSDLQYLVICEPAWVISDVEIIDGMADSAIQNLSHSVGLAMP
jgi:mannose-6-phosphate isomerase-like protein (cupin superfamily)